MARIQFVAHVFVVFLVYFILDILLKDASYDRRVPTTADIHVLEALRINHTIFEYRALRFNKYASSERQRKGFGELGRGVNLNLPKDEMNSLIDKYGYNSKACSKIALDRLLGNMPAYE